MKHSDVILPPVCDTCDGCFLSCESHALAPVRSLVPGVRCCSQNIDLQETPVVVYVSDLLLQGDQDMRARTLGSEPHKRKAQRS